MRVSRLTSDKNGAELEELLKRDRRAVALIKEEEFMRLTASGISLRTLAEGETLAHGGLTIELLRRPSVERLRIVQGGAFEPKR
jgi:hypothetical protein